MCILYFCSFTCSLFLLSLLFQKNIILLIIDWFFDCFSIWCYCFALHSFLQHWYSFMFFLQCIFSKIYIVHFLFTYDLYFIVIIFLYLNTYPFAVVYILVAHRPVGSSAFRPFLLFSFSRVSTFHVCPFSTFIPFTHACPSVFPLSLFPFVHVLFPVFRLSPFVLSFLHSCILAFSLSLALAPLAPLAPLVPLVPLVPVALWPLAIFVDRTFSDQNLEQVPGGAKQSAGASAGADRTFVFRIRTLGKCQAEIAQLVGTATECCLQFSRWNAMLLALTLFPAATLSTGTAQALAQVFGPNNIKITENRNWNKYIKTLSDIKNV